MQHALTLDGRTVALDLYDVLRDLDPARWRDEFESATRARVQRILTQLGELSNATTVPESLEQLREGMGELADLIEQRLPDPHLSEAELRANWMQFRAELQPAYEGLARSLSSYAIHVPSLRPTNYTRNFFHALGGTTALVFLQHVFTPTTLALVAGSITAAAWTMEGGRRYIKGANDLLMKLFSMVAHPHEAHRVNSSTWFATALFIISLTASIRTASLAVVVLAFADPAAALVGRRFGSIQLVNGRSLQGTLAFAGVGTLACLAVLGIYSPELTLLQTLAISVGAASLGAVVELFSKRVDDNLSIPLAVAAGAGLIGMALGLS